ncbi:hypothetical protein GGX14DRAFT_580380 [Mycena pura]|uniref:Uncharacterized protein n=1 Tax=Mycena pura TaxID=153505 RepID=A0AAD6UP38_9AGAR|nr:hypothetical protein GGX14DRAFT_580380 [Mycena pura]
MHDHAASRRAKSFLNNHHGRPLPCGCGSKNVSKTTRQRHLEGGGHMQAKVTAAEWAVNYTSRLLERFKRKRSTDGSGGSDAEGPTQKSVHVASPSPQASFAGEPMQLDHADSSPSLADTSGPQLQPPVPLAENLPYLLATRPHVLPTLSDDSADSRASDVSRSEPQLTFTDPGDADHDPELDDALLEHCELSAEEHLSEQGMNAIRAHNYKVNVDLGSRAYNKLRRAFPQLNVLH